MGLAQHLAGLIPVPRREPVLFEQVIELALRAFKELGHITAPA